MASSSSTTNIVGCLLLSIIFYSNRKCKMKLRTEFPLRIRPYPAAVIFDKAAANGQSEAEPILFRRLKRVEQVPHHVRWNPPSAIAHRNQYLTGSNDAGRHAQFA